MPTWPPRSNSTKKREQLVRREEELRHAIRSAAAPAVVMKGAERVRLAQLSILKAERHWTRDIKMRRKNVATGLHSIEKGITEWQEKPVGAIIAAYTKGRAILQS